MAEKWFYINALGEKIGPLASRALKTLADTGVLEPKTIIIAESNGKKYEAGIIRGLFQTNDDPFSSGVFVETVAKTPELDSDVRAITPLPSSQTLPLTLAPPSAQSGPPTPPGKPKPLSASLFDSGVPMPVVLQSVGEKIHRPKPKGNWIDNSLIFGLLGVIFLFVFGILVVYVTLQIVSKQMEEQAKKLAEYDGLVEKKVVLPDGNEMPVFLPEDGNAYERVIIQAEPSIALVSGLFHSGTGFVVAPGIIATNYHVIAAEQIESLEIGFHSAKEGERGPYKPRLLYENEARDIALLEIDSLTQAPLPIVKDYRFRRAQKVITIGNPGRGDGVVLENAVTAGILSTQTEVDGQPFYQLSIAIEHGNSGGPVLDDEGKVVGIVTLKAAKSPSMAYCIPVSELEKSLVIAHHFSASEKRQASERHSAVALQRREAEQRERSVRQTADNADWFSGPQEKTINDFLVPSSSSQQKEAEQEAAMDSIQERRYEQIVNKEEWIVSGVPIYGRIVGYRDGIVLIRLKGAAESDPPVNRYARLFSPSDISDIIFYARYHGIPTGNLRMGK